MAQRVTRKRTLPTNANHDHSTAAHSARERDAARPRQLRRIRRWIVRRVRLLIALLHKYPYVLALIILSFCFAIFGTSIILRNSVAVLPQTSDPFLRELNIQLNKTFSDSDLLERFGVQDIQQVSNFEQTADGMFFKALLKDGSNAIISTSDQTASNANDQEDMLPRVHRLANIVGLSDSIARCYNIQLPVVLNSDLSDRHTSRALIRACGYRSRTQVPQGMVLDAYVLILESKSKLVASALDMPAIEPYDWQFRFASSDDCRISQLKSLEEDLEKYRGRIRECRRLTEMMVVLYLSGCRPLGNGDIIQRNGSDSGYSTTSGVAIGFAKRCFLKGQSDNEVSLSILKSYLVKSKMLPSGFLGRISGMIGMSWHVGHRAQILVEQLNRMNLAAGDAGWNEQWTFY